MHLGSEGGDRRVIIPEGMENIYSELGYAPAVKVGSMIYCAGQVGRDSDLRVIPDPADQIQACWDNLFAVLKAAGCTFHDVIDLTTYHVDMEKHYTLFREIKNKVFPRGFSTWTSIGVSALSRPGLIVEIKAIALEPQE